MGGVRAWVVWWRPNVPRPSYNHTLHDALNGNGVQSVEGSSEKWAPDPRQSGGGGGGGKWEFPGGWDVCGTPGGHRRDLTRRRLLLWLAVDGFCLPWPGQGGHALWPPCPLESASQPWVLSDPLSTHAPRSRLERHNSNWKATESDCLLPPGGYYINFVWELEEVVTPRHP